MSTDETSHSPRRRWPMSWVNTILVIACVVGAIIAFVVDNPVSGVALLIAGLGAGASAVYARRGTSGDLERVSALEYADERDRAAATKGLAIVGVVSLIASVAQLIVHAVLQTGGIGMWTSIVLVFVLSIAWFVGNWYAVRRG